MQLQDAMRQDFVAEVLPAIGNLLAAAHQVRDPGDAVRAGRRTGEPPHAPLARFGARLETALAPWRGLFRPAEALPGSMRSAEAVEFIEAALGWIDTFGPPKAPDADYLRAAARMTAALDRLWTE